MEDPASEQPEVSLRGTKFWVILTLWIVAISVMSVLSVRKAFKWAGDVNQYQQERADEFGPTGSGEPTGT